MKIGRYIQIILFKLIKIIVVRNSLHKTCHFLVMVNLNFTKK